MTWNYDRIGIILAENENEDNNENDDKKSTASPKHQHSPETDIFKEFLGARIRFYVSDAVGDIACWQGIAFP